ncbi:MAG: hypothetical protein WAK04_05130 [Xanthobacteraceae bacterium]
MASWLVVVDEPATQGSQVLAFDDRDVVQLLRAAIEREGIKQLMRGVMALSALA